MSLATTERRHHVSSGAWANWLWLADPPALETALSLGSEAEVAQALGRFFAQVERSPAEPGALTASWDAGTFDLIALDATETDDSNTVSDGLWRVCVELLRPGGCLMLTMDNPLWHKRLRDGPRALVQMRRTKRRERKLRAAGFRAIQSYYMAPSAHEPRSFIPKSRHVVAGYERVAMKLSTRGPLRSRLARAGLHPVLYPSTLHLAYR